MRALSALLVLLLLAPSAIAPGTASIADPAGDTVVVIGGLPLPACPAPGADLLGVTITTSATHLTVRATLAAPPTTPVGCIPPPVTQEYSVWAFVEAAQNASVSANVIHVATSPTQYRLCWSVGVDYAGRGGDCVTLSAGGAFSGASYAVTVPIAGTASGALGTLTYDLHGGVVTRLGAGAFSGGPGYSASDHADGAVALAL